MKYHSLNLRHQTHQLRKKRQFPLQNLPGVPRVNVRLYVSLFFGNLQHHFFTWKETKTSTRILLRSAIIKFLVQGCLVLNDFCFIKHKAAKLHLFFNDDKHFVDRYDSWFNPLFHQELKDFVWGSTHSESDLFHMPCYSRPTITMYKLLLFNTSWKNKLTSESAIIEDNCQIRFDCEKILTLFGR